MHVVSPAVAEYLPISQVMQVATLVALTAVEYLPTTQSVQVVAATIVEYFPATQVVHWTEPVVFL
jgi:hypothetical protein